MNKGDLTEAVAEATGQSNAASRSAVDAVFSEITKALKKKDSVVIVGFGTFSVARREARTGRNPKTGESIKIKAHNSPKFKSGKSLKDAVR